MGKKNMVLGKGMLLLLHTGVILFTCRYLPASEKEVSLCPPCRGVASCEDRCDSVVKDLFNGGKIMYRKILWPCLLLFAITFGSVLSANAGEPTDLIKRTADKIISIVANPEYKGIEKRGERNRLIRAAVDEIFGREEMSRRTLARHWRKRTPEEKQEFMELFEDLLEQTYIDRVEGYSGQEVLYVGEKIEGSYALVKVEIMTKQQKKIPVLYRLKKKKDRGWVVYDLSIEGVSLINNYRNQFNSIITNSSFADLIKKLKEKVQSPPAG